MKRYFKTYTDKEFIDCGIDYRLVLRMIDEHDGLSGSSSIQFIYPEDYIYDDNIPPKSIDMEVVTDNQFMEALLKERKFTYDKDV